MTTKARKAKRALSNPATNSVAAKPGFGSEAHPASAARRVWCMRAAALLLLPALLLGLLEGGLRLFGTGYPTSFFLPTEDGKFFTTNPRFCWTFQPHDKATQPNRLLLPREKPRGSYRIFVLGESAAAGTPDPSFGFARILESMLRTAYPEKRFEMVNAAVRGINSHAVLPIARECVEHQPDLAIVYMGNNEVIGLHAPSPGTFNLTPFWRLLRIGQWLKTTRTAQMMELAAGKVHAKSAPRQDMAYFRSVRLAADARERQAVYANYDRNLRDICGVLRKHGVEVVVATLASNLGDFPPIASLHRSGLADTESAQWEKAYGEGVEAESLRNTNQALSSYISAARIDDHYADLHFRMARCYATLGSNSLAQVHYSLARDWDAMQFRADTRLNQIVRKMAASNSDVGIHFVDIEHLLAESPLSRAGVPGEALFNDHVHFTFAGDHLVASNLVSPVATGLRLGGPSAPVPSAKDCAARLAFSPWDAYNVRISMVDSLKKPPFLDQLDHEARQRSSENSLAAEFNALVNEGARIQAAYRSAVAQSPGDWQLHANFGKFLVEGCSDPVSAVREYESAVALFPQSPELRSRLEQARSLSATKRDSRKPHGTKLD